MAADRFTPSGLNSHFIDCFDSFDDYCTGMHEIIRRTRSTFAELTATDLAAANGPAEYHPEHANGHGILLVHGLFDSCHILTSLAKHLAKQGMLVRTLLLPGHGTVPGDLLDVRMEDWQAAVQFGLETLQASVAHIHYLGLSTGALLGIDAAQQGFNFSSLSLLSPAFKINSRFSGLANVLAWAGRYIPSLRFACRQAENDYAKYQSFPFNAVGQLNRLISRVATHSQPLQVPTFMVMSDDDEVVSPAAAVHFFRHNIACIKAGIYYGSKTITPLPNELEQRQSHFPEEHILNFSHPCLPVAPDHPHYGRNGDYVNYHGFLGGIEPFVQVSDDNPRWSGAIKRKYLRQYAMQRLSYNPDFDTMLQRMVDFMHLRR